MTKTTEILWTVCYPDGNRINRLFGKKHWAIKHYMETYRSDTTWASQYKKGYRAKKFRLVEVV